MKKAVVALRGCQYFVEVLALRVRDKDLPEVVATHVVDDIAHAAVVEFVENIVKQEQRRVAMPLLLEIKELRQFSYT